MIELFKPTGITNNSSFFSVASIMQQLKTTDLIDLTMLPSGYRNIDSSIFLNLDCGSYSLGLKQYAYYNPDNIVLMYLSSLRYFIKTLWGYI